MRLIKFDPSAEIPIIDSKIFGPMGSKRVRLVFDTGAGSTQLNTTLIENLGYSAIHANKYIRVTGPAGDFQEGYQINLEQLNLFGLKFSGIPIGVYDFDNFDHYGIDGLLGFDVIKQLHLEMIGSKGKLKVY